ncbi:hypothetical protein [Paenibacillus timonensis]|uniref:hypothetical protein n=1 Tax=Paenibacillus timonensis TaxID=225915 RepID=UPI0022E4874C|nr:hypothetical protein [Paenibacillus timonensis]
MANIRLQDLTATIAGTSRYNGGKWDTVHVETLLVTDEPLPNDMNWYVPAGVSIPPEALAMFNATGLSMFPTLEANLLNGTEDIRDQAQQNNLPEVMSDAAKLMMRSVMKKTPLIPIPDAPTTYLLSYDYKLYPRADVPNAFEFTVRLPFDGLRIHPQGGRVQVSVLSPVGARIDEAATLGRDENGQEISELVVPLQNANRFAVTFGYQLDPDFIIRYVY